MATINDPNCVIHLCTYVCMNMDLRANNRLLVTTSDEVSRIYRELQTSEEALKKSAEEVQKWYLLQPHLPKPAPDLKDITTLLVVTKMSIEKVKSKLDMRCLLRILNPEFFKYSDLIDSGLDAISKNVYWFPLPKLTEDLCRVNVLKIMGDPNEFSLEAHFKRSFIFAEYRLKTDCCLSDRYILDLSNMKWGHFTKINPILIKNAEIVNKKAYGMRIAGIHILNAPPFVDKLIILLKGALKPKLASRVKCHLTLDDLHKEISKDVLPTEYGGLERSLNALNDEWYEEITSDTWKNTFLNEEKQISDESKRLNFPLDDDLLGIQGSFRKLDFD
ncbi:alpha-tocopherol transfer protein-like [Arctopsyche grandis]|uniref:alpha-tocopherol transfer protein-like n=1 Tax=Arctopsyche grandis TaxID=121162 RepID=UPI00406D7851